MTNEEINKTIAEACGWKQISIHMGLATVWVDPSGNKQENFPDYCNDLNAMHEAELTLTEEDRLKYANHLSQIFNSSYKKAWWDLNAKEAFEVINASAKQKAEAFLKTLGKWEASPES